MIFDTHAHYDDEAFDEDREQLLASFKENGIDAVTNVAASISSFHTFHDKWNINLSTLF